MTPLNLDIPTQDFDPTPLEAYTEMYAFNVITCKFVQGVISSDNQTLRIDVFDDLENYYVCENYDGQQLALTNRPITWT